MAAWTCASASSTASSFVAALNVAVAASSAKVTENADAAGTASASNASSYVSVSTVALSSAGAVLSVSVSRTTSDAFTGPAPSFTWTVTS